MPLSAEAACRALVGHDPRQQFWERVYATTTAFDTTGP